MHIRWKTLLPITNFYNFLNIMWHNVTPLKYALDFNLLANGHFLSDTSNGGNLCVYIENMLTKQHTSLSTSKILNASRWYSMKILAKVQEVTWQGLCLQQLLNGDNVWFHIWKEKFKASYLKCMSLQYMSYTITN